MKAPAGPQFPHQQFSRDSEFTRDSQHARSQLINTTPFPNALLDEVMPGLKDTAWRVLCVIVRQTLGWHDQTIGGRKERDWLSRSQLRTRTGRDSEALAVAIASLVRQGLISVQDEDGHPLLTPEARRAHRGRIYYSLAKSWRKRLGLPPDATIPPQAQGWQKAQGWQNAASCIMPGKVPMHGLCSINRLEQPEIEHEAVEKSNITKETLTNKDQRIDNEKIQKFMKLFESVATETGKPAARSQSTSDPSPGAAQEEIGQLARFLQKHDQNDWRPLFKRFFASDSEYIRRQGYSLTAFIHSYYLLQYSAMRSE